LAEHFVQATPHGQLATGHLVTRNSQLATDTLLAMNRLQRLIAALWLGSAFFLMLAASAAFRAAPNPTAAADVVGAMLTRWHYIAIAAPLVLFAIELRRVRRGVLIVLFIALLLAAAQSFVDLRIRTIRFASPVPISSLAPDDPVRRNFGALHGVSMMLLLLQAIAASVVVMARQRHDGPSARSQSESVSPSESQSE